MGEKAEEEEHKHEAEEEKAEEEDTDEQNWKFFLVARMGLIYFTSSDCIEQCPTGKGPHFAERLRCRVYSTNKDIVKVPCLTRNYYLPFKDDYGELNLVSPEDIHGGIHKIAHDTMLSTDERTLHM